MPNDFVEHLDLLRYHLRVFLTIFFKKRTKKNLFESHQGCDQDIPRIFIRNLAKETLYLKCRNFDEF